MKKLILPLALITALFSPVSKAEDEYAVYGYGKMICATWTNKRKVNDYRAHALKVWVMGFVSGYGFSGRSGLEQTNEEVMWGYIDNYCAANPGDSLSEAASALINELVE